MKKLSSLLLFLVTVLALFVSITGTLASLDLTARILQILFIPVTIYLVLTLINHLVNGTPPLDRKSGLERLLIYYCFIITSVLVVVSFLSSRTLAHFVSSAIFSSLAFYFLLLVLPRVSYTVAIPIAKGGTKKRDLKDLLIPSAKIDVERRDFLKLIGTAGVTAFILSLFTKRGAPFFATATGTSSLLDSSGKKINPAEKSPTDNYFIAEIDDSTTVSYFGFVNDVGQWYIMRENADGAFRYTRGNNDFNASWANRSNLNYDHFDKIF